MVTDARAEADGSKRRARRRGISAYPGKWAFRPIDTFETGPDIEKGKAVMP